MKKTFMKIFSDNLALLPSKYKREKCAEIIGYLQRNETVSGVLWGGSISYKKDIKKGDIDLFCLINRVSDFEIDLINYLHDLTDVDVVIYQGIFPWTEKLYTIYYKQDIDFSIDLCLIEMKNAKNFFWEPDGKIIFDKSRMIDKCRNKQMKSPNFTRHPFLKSNPFSLSVITLKKIDKNLARGHLWNALEQLNILRRYIMQIIRIDFIKHNYFLGRVDRDFEDVIPPEVNLSLSETVAIYDSQDIALKSILLIKILATLTDYLKNGSEQNYYGWVLKQLKHEKIKLENRTNNA